MEQGAMQATHVGLVLEIEEAAYAAWPALVRREFAGWRFRAAAGVTGRANSVWAMQHDASATLERSIIEAEHFYAGNGLRARFQVNGAVQPAGLDRALEARGYARTSPTQVQTVPLSLLVQRSPALGQRADLVAEVAEEFDPEWFAIYEAAAKMDAQTSHVRQQILRGLPSPFAFATVYLDGEAAGVGLGVACGGWLGLFSVETAPHLRRRGVATAILRTLALWGTLHGAGNAYLQVNDANASALHLYAGLGFTTTYPYHYRLQPASEVDSASSGDSASTGDSTSTGDSISSGDSISAGANGERA